MPKVHVKVKVNGMLLILKLYIEKVLRIIIIPLVGIMTSFFYCLENVY